MSTLTDPVRAALEAGERRVSESRTTDAEAAGGILLDEIALFIRVGDPVALAIAGAVHRATSEESGTAVSVTTAALDAYTRATDPDLLPPGLSAF